VESPLSARETADDCCKYENRCDFASHVKPSLRAIAYQRNAFVQECCTLLRLLLTINPPYHSLTHSA
jgi:hypothetical protein